MMFGRKPCKDALPSLTGYEVQDYQTMLKDKLAELRDFVEPEASPLMNTSHKQDWQPPQTDHLLVEGTPPVLVEHAPPEDPGVEVSEEPNTMPGCLAEPDLPALEQVRPREGFAARYPTRIRHQTQRL
ncbi:hypothetical protein EMCRGX_G015536 [Ephydatia muelleri]